MTRRNKRNEQAEYRAAITAYVAMGADESVQRVVTAVHRLSKRLNQWYDRQLADLDVSSGEWSVLTELARLSDEQAMTPSALAEAADVSPSSMTGRLDRMVERGLVTREPDPSNRTRVLVRLSDHGYEFYATAIQESNVVESDVLSPLSEKQRNDLASLLESLISHVDEADL